MARPAVAPGPPPVPVVAMGHAVQSRHVAPRLAAPGGLPRKAPSRQRLRGRRRPGSTARRKVRGQPVGSRGAAPPRPRQAPAMRGHAHRAPRLMNGPATIPGPSREPPGPGVSTPGAPRVPSEAGPGVGGSGACAGAAAGGAAAGAGGAVAAEGGCGAATRRRMVPRSAVAWLMDGERGGGSGATLASAAVAAAARATCSGPPVTPWSAVRSGKGWRPVSAGAVKGPSATTLSGDGVALRDDRFVGPGPTSRVSIPALAEGGVAIG